MKRVVECLPDAAAMAACGLKPKDFRVDAAAYRRFVEGYARAFAAFRRTRGTEAPGEAGEEALRAAFEATLPPYQYEGGLFYRCRADGPAGTPLVECYQREEITGWVGIPPGPMHQGALRVLFSWIAAGLRRRRDGKETTEP